MSERLAKKIKELEVKLHNHILAQMELNQKQSDYNVGVANNINALGREVFPAAVNEGVKSGIITP